VKAEQRARRMQERAVTRARERVREAPPVAQLVVRGEFPAQVLLRAAEARRAAPVHDKVVALDARV
jgi:hypothetical protein